MILIYIALAYLSSLPLVFVYFLDITLSLKIKKINNEEKQDQAPKRRHILNVLYNIWLVVIEEKY